MTEKTRIAAWAVLAAIFITTLKLVVGLATSSLGILSEAADSTLDILAMGIVVFAMRFADRPADHSHPYGHGKIENLSALIAIGLLIVTCFTIIVEAVQRLFFDMVEVNANAWAFGTMFVTMGIDFWLSRQLRQAARTHNSDALEASALRFSGDIWNSCITLLGLGLVTLGQWTGQVWLERGDAVAALILAFAMLLAALRVGKRSSDVLLDAAPRGLVSDIEKRTQQVDGVLSAKQVRVRRVGPTTFVDMSIAVERATTFEESHRIASAVETVVQSLLPHADVLVHVDPIAQRGESLMDTLRGIAAKHELEVHSVRIQHIAHQLYILFHVEVDDSLTLQEAHALVSHLEDEVRREIPNAAEVTSHIEPAGQHGAESTLPNDVLMAAQAEVERIAREECGAHGFHQVSVHCVDGELDISLHIFFDDQSPIRIAHDVATHLEARLRREIANVGPVLVHVEPRSIAANSE
jgi:cation diffusion facilitator family transporter